MASNKHRAVWDWLQSCPYIGDLFFSAAQPKAGCTVLVPSDQLVDEYINGTQQRNYNCALTRFQAFTADANDASSITVVTDLEELGEWVEKQARLGNVPAFPEGTQITDIRVLPNESGYMVAQDMTMAKYMIQFQISYDKTIPNDIEEDDDNV